MASAAGRVFDAATASSVFEGDADAVTGEFVRRGLGEIGSPVLTARLISNWRADLRFGDLEAVFLRGDMIVDGQDAMNE